MMKKSMFFPQASDTGSWVSQKYAESEPKTKTAAELTVRMHQ